MFDGPTCVQTSFSFQMCNWRSLARYHVGCSFRTRVWPNGCWIEWNNRRETSCLARLWLLFDIPLLCLFYLPLLIHYAQLICGCHHGQFWLSYQRFIYPGISPFGWIYHHMVWIRSWRKVSQETFFANKVVEEKSKKGYVNIWLLFSGKIHYTEVFDMLRSIDPPLGFGKKCPERQAYKKLIRMNMPMDKEGKVSFQLAKKTSPPCLSLFKSLFQKKKENHYSPFFSSSVL